uniref:Uncharacterized protein n=1 Tax=Athene cunicularia TaxID=194338 RepID=A0A663M4X8_ATHCN
IFVSKALGTYKKPSFPPSFKCKRDVHKFELGNSSLTLPFFPKKYCLVHAPLGPVASIATSITESGVIHLRNTRKRKFRTAKRAKMYPVTGPQ